MYSLGKITARSDTMVLSPVIDGHQERKIGARIGQITAQQIERLVTFGSFAFDFETGVLTCSDGASTLLGLPPGRVLTVDQAVRCCDREVWDDAVRQVRAAHEADTPCELTIPFRSSTGRAGWARVIVQIETIEGSRRLVGVARSIGHERGAEERLHQPPGYDVLTGLRSRRAFQEHLDEAVATRLAEVPLGLCLINIDRFKAVNDAHGHAIGDRLLQEIGRRLSATVQSGDAVARMGDDEFAVLLSRLSDRADLRRRVAALHDVIGAPLVLPGLTIEPSVSAGASVIGVKSTNASGALKQADLALARAKLDGGDQFCLFQPSLRRDVDHQQRLLDEVRAGLPRGEFEVHYQPIVDLRTHIVRGWEALIRWRHPKMGLLLPGSFMPALNDPKTSVAIGDFVLGSSLRQMRQWLDGGVPVTCAGVNVSDAQLKRGDLVPTITALLRDNKLTPDRLKIEVLETAFLGMSTQAVATTIDQLARMGVVSALDDFGTGHASLIHLKQFRVERIKIDRSFVTNLSASAYDQAIVRCMIRLGQDLGIRITAEGIETVEQLAMLRGLGCDCGQGYLFSRPMHADAVPAFLTRWHGGEADKLFGGDGMDGPDAPMLERLAGAG